VLGSHEFNFELFVLLGLAHFFSKKTYLPKLDDKTTTKNIRGKGQNYENQNVKKPKEHQKCIKASEHRKS
jgi:hypothetical protein